MTQPIDHLKSVIETVDGLAGKVYLYQYDSPQQITTPAAVLNYAGTDEATAIRGQIRITIDVRVQIFGNVGDREDLSKLMLDSIRKCFGDARVTRVTGGSTSPLNTESQSVGALRTMVVAEFLATVRT